jgi:hypothetical protein
MHGIDGARRWRYSQAQIPDLVAYTIPRSRRTVQSCCSAKLNAQKTPAKAKRPASNDCVWLSALSARPRCAGKLSCCRQTELPMKFCISARKLPATAAAGIQSLFNIEVEAADSFEDRP